MGQTGTVFEQLHNKHRLKVLRAATAPTAAERILCGPEQRLQRSPHLGGRQEGEKEREGGMGGERAWELLLEMRRRSLRRGF